jgi:hypothetical protein
MNTSSIGTEPYPPSKAADIKRDYICILDLRILGKFNSFIKNDS